MTQKPTESPPESKWYSLIIRTDDNEWHYLKGMTNSLTQDKAEAARWEGLNYATWASNKMTGKLKYQVLVCVSPVEAQGKTYSSKEK